MHRASDCSSLSSFILTADFGTMSTKAIVKEGVLCMLRNENFDDTPLEEGLPGIGKTEWQREEKQSKFFELEGKWECVEGYVGHKRVSTWDSGTLVLASPEIELGEFTAEFTMSDGSGDTATLSLASDTTPGLNSITFLFSYSSASYVCRIEVSRDSTGKQYMSITRDERPVQGDSMAGYDYQALIKGEYTSRTVWQKVL